MTTLSALNRCDEAEFGAALAGMYEHSAWIAQRTASRRPFSSVAALKLALRDTVAAASIDEQLALICAHPALAGKAALAGQLTPASTQEQAASGLHLYSAEHYAARHQLNADYKRKFGFPFILAVTGPDGKGLTRQSIIDTFARRLTCDRASEMAECLRQIDRIAELRLAALLSVQLAFGPAILQRCEDLAAWSDIEGGLTCAYLTPAHRRAAARVDARSRHAGAHRRRRQRRRALPVGPS